MNNSDKELAETMLRGLNNMREYLLSKNDDIKKYYKWRKIQGEILSSMNNYATNGNYDLNYEFSKANKDILNELNGNAKAMTFELDLQNEFDRQIFIELQVYKNHFKMDSITEKYIEKNKFKNKDKIDFLNAMNNSFVSFFKIVNKDYNGYVNIEDLITGNEYKIIDIALSNPIRKNDTYIYSRIFSIDGISFASPLFVFPKNNKVINNYINNLKRKKISNIAKTLEAFELYKQYGIDFIINDI